MVEYHRKTIGTWGMKQAKLIICCTTRNDDLNGDLLWFVTHGLRVANVFERTGWLMINW